MRIPMLDNLLCTAEEFKTCFEDVGTLMDETGKCGGCPACQLYEAIGKDKESQLIFRELTDLAALSVLMTGDIDRWAITLLVLGMKCGRAHVENLLLRDLDKPVGGVGK